MVEQEQREEDGVDDIAMKAEGFLFLTGGIVAMLGTKAIADILATIIDRGFIFLVVENTYLGAFMPSSWRLRCSLTSLKASLRSKLARSRGEMRNGEYVLVVDMLRSTA